MHATTVRTDRLTLPGGARVALHRFGSGRPDLLALHGFTGSGLDFAALDEHVSGALYCPDLPGHGGSDLLGRGGSDLFGNGGSDLLGQAAGTDSAGIEACGDVLAGLAAAIGLSHYVLLGYSMGGRTALTLALRHPGTVRALVLIGASPGLRAATDREQRRMVDEQRALDLELHGAEAFIERWQNLPLLRSQRRMPAGYWREFSARRRSANPMGLAGSLRAMGTGSMPPLWTRLGDLSVPTLLITGEQDERYSSTAAEMAALIPNALCKRIKGAGHSPHFERPQQVAHEIAEFLDGIGGAT